MAARLASVVTLISLLGALAASGGCASGKADSLPAPPGNPSRVESLNDGRIRIERAGRRAVLDLAEEISGCTSRLHDPMEDETYETRVAVEIVDETEKAPYLYVVLVASAPPNCNVQGHCGAGGPDSTLIWLKLRRNLSLVEKQAVVLDDCRRDRYAVVTRHPEDPEDQYGGIHAEDLVWVGSTLSIELEEGESSVGRLIYDRQNPDQGLQEVRGKDPRGREKANRRRG